MQIKPQIIMNGDDEDKVVTEVLVRWTNIFHEVTRSWKNNILIFSNVEDKIAFKEVK